MGIRPAELAWIGRRPSEIRARGLTRALRRGTEGVADRGAPEDAMRHTWRWFGPVDTVSTDGCCRPGVEASLGAASRPYCEVWAPEAIAARQAEVGRRGRLRLGLAWEVVESLPVSEDVKRQTGGWREHLEAYRASLATSPPPASRSSATISCRCSTGPAPTSPGGSRMAAPACASTSPTSPPSTSTSSPARGREDYTPEVRGRGGAPLPQWRTPSGAELTRNVAFGLPGSAEHLKLDGLRPS